MYRRGHVGITMLAYAPVAYILLREGQLGLALVGLLGVHQIEPLPDADHWIPGLTHRGTSHSLFAVLVVGASLGVLGWVIGDQLSAVLIGLDPPTVGPFAGVFEIVAEQLRRLDGSALAQFGFAVGAFGVLTHLFGDVITVSGIRPLLPLSRWRLSLSRLRADNDLANNVLLGIGVVSLVAVAFATAPVGPTLSPIGVASAQEDNSSHNAVTMPNQTTNGSTVTITNATLSRGGYIVVHSGAYQDAGILQDSAIAVSGYLDSGSHGNVTIPINRSPPGGTLNQSELNGTDDLTAILWHETGNNTRFEGVSSGGTEDTPYTTGENGSQQYVTDTSRVIVNGTRGDPNAATPSASIALDDQETDESVVTIANASLPDGGWVVVHNESYSDNPTGSAVGISRYLEPGNYSNVEAELMQGSVTSEQTLTAVPYRDTNGNQRYDYVSSDGFQDTGYVNRTGDEAFTVNDTASVTADGSEAASASTDTDDEMDEDNPANTSTPFRIVNLSANRTAHLDDEIVVEAQVENPTNSRLEGELSVATAGDTADTQDVALFPTESRTVTFEYSYDSPGEYVIKVGNRTAHISVVEEGEELPTTTAAERADGSSGGTANGSTAQEAQSDSDEAIGLTSPPVLIIGGLILVGVVGWGLRRRRNQNDF
nr:metal-dependent hydrolase [Halococcus salsus]